MRKTVKLYTVGQSFAKKDNSIFPLLWLQTSRANPSHRNLNLVFNFRWQSTFTLNHGSG